MTVESKSILQPFETVIYRAPISKRILSKTHWRRNVGFALVVGASFGQLGYREILRDFTSSDALLSVGTGIFALLLFGYALRARYEAKLAANAKSNAGALEAYIVTSKRVIALRSDGVVEDELRFTDAESVVNPTMSDKSEILVVRRGDRFASQSMYLSNIEDSHALKRQIEIQLEMARP